MGYYGRVSLTVDRRAMMLGLVALGGCGQLGNVGAVVDKAGPLIDTVKRVADDVTLISDGLTPIILAIKDAVPPATVGRVADLITGLKDSAAELSKVSSAPAGQSTVQKVVAAVSGIAAAAAPFLVGTPYGQVLVAAQALLPTIQAAVGLVADRPRTARVAMAPDDARSVLARSAGRGGA